MPMKAAMSEIDDKHIARTARSLVRAYGARARAEARAWTRHFAETGARHERTVWARVGLELRRLTRERGEEAA